MPTPANPIYLDWQFWSALTAIIAIILSQLPPIHLLLRPRRLEVEVHSRIQITHKIGNPNIGMVVSVRNTGGRELPVRSLQLSISRDGANLGTFPVQNYFETPSSLSSVLFIPFSLRPGESWAHATNFLNFFDRATEKNVRNGQAELMKDIQKKIEARPEENSQAVIAEQELVKPFTDLFNRLFIWTPGEYEITLKVVTAPQSASFSRKYRFTLFESDSSAIVSHTEDYKFGGGLSYDVERHIAISVPLSQHNT